jgi:hypothetical protein
MDYKVILTMGSIRINPALRCLIAYWAVCNIYYFSLTCLGKGGIAYVLLDGLELNRLISSVLELIII